MVKTYLDSCVLIAAVMGNHKLFQKAFAIIDDPNREFIFSDFVKFELLPKAIFEKNKGEEDFYRQFFSKAVEVKVEIDSVESSEAFRLACTYGLSAGDAMHLQAAINGKACEFITTEKDTKPFFKAKSNVSFQIVSIHENANKK